MSVHGIISIMYVWKYCTRKTLKTGQFMHTCFVNLNTQKCQCDLLLPLAYHKNLNAVYKNYANNLTEGVQDFRKKNQKEPIVKCVGLSQISAGLRYPASFIYIDSSDFPKSC